MDITIRLESVNDYRGVEELTRKAFWNIHVPGCNEHYLVHVMRSHQDFCGDLDYVAEYDGELVGNIMYTKSWLIDPNGERIDIVTFGPLSVLPKYQRRGIGTKLIEHTAAIVKAKGYPAIVIFGNPSNYVKHGFKGSKKYGIGLSDGRYPTSLLVLPINFDSMKDTKWVYMESEVYSVDSKKAEEFEKSFPIMEKGYRPSQEEFSILSRSYVV